MLHAHYAVPHATAAYLAHQILTSSYGANGAPRTVTTLHGTDITLGGRDPSYARVVAFSIEQSDAVTAVSESLRRQTLESLGIQHPIRVIEFSRLRQLSPSPRRHQLRHRLCRGGEREAVVLHVSNFRPVKRVDMVLDVFRKIREEVRSRLVLVRRRPDRGQLERRVAELNLGESVDFVGDQLDLVSWLSTADLFLLPSSQESFGLAALEAMACEVVVVASRVGGLPEVIEDGVTGFLCAPDDVDGMARRGIEILQSLTRGTPLDTRRRVVACEILHGRHRAAMRACCREVAGLDAPSA